MQNRDTTASLVLDWIDRATVAKQRQQDKVNDEWKDRVGLQHATIALAVGMSSLQQQKILAKIIASSSTITNLINTPFCISFIITLPFIAPHPFMESSLL